MSILTFISILFLLTAVSGAINLKYLHLPMTIGVMIIAFTISLFLFLADHFSSLISSYSFAQHFLSQLNFSTLFLNGALAFLLFSGSLVVNLDELWKARNAVASLSILGTLFSILFLGLLFWGLFQLFHIPISFLWSCILGAIISPTDPIVIIDMLGRLGLPKHLQAIFAGESLFNDGVALVVFSTLFSLAVFNHTPTFLELSILLIKEIAGSCAVGILTAAIIIFIIKRLNHNEISILFSIALATGTFSIANHFHMSGPIAVVVSGLLLGNHLQKQKDNKNELVIQCWQVIDTVLNTLLFLLIGLQIMIIPFNSRIFIITLIAFPFLTLTRLLALILSGSVMVYRDSNPKGLISILTWGGLRGGISLAIALSLPNIHPKNEILLICYICVVLTILIQGLSMEPLVKYFYKQ